VRTPTVNPDWAKLPLFDRSKWQCVRFDDVVENLNETERDPEAHGIERFIGLEHLEPGSLHIRAWGNVADGTTFTRLCRLGQVLFGKRRAYQRKVAVAEFDAVVSGDIYVLAPKNDRLLPGLLPFLCMSERFFQHAVETSAGSLSPRTNWSSLASFEFALPPLDQQHRIAEILWAVDENSQRWRSVQQDAEQLRSSYAIEVYGLRNSQPDGLQTKGLLSDLAEINPSLGAQLDDDMEVSFVAMADVSEDGHIINSQTKQYKDVRKGYTSFRDGDVLFAKITPCMENGKGALAATLVNGLGFGSTEFHVLRPKLPEDADFIYHLTMIDQFRAAARRYMRGSAGQQRVPANFLTNYSLMIADRERRKEIGATLTRMTRQIEGLAIVCRVIGSVNTALLGALFGGQP
jgi:type I restriction enzyme S subunit